MVRFELTEEKKQRIVVVFSEHFEVEELGLLKNAILDAIKGLTSDKDKACEYDESIYWLCDLLQELEFSYEQSQNLALCEMLSKERLETLYKIKYKKEYKEQLTHNEKELDEWFNE